MGRCAAPPRLARSVSADTYCSLAAQGAGVSDDRFCHRLARALTAHYELRVAESQYAITNGHAGAGSTAIPGQSTLAVLEHPGWGESHPRTRLGWRGRLREWRAPDFPLSATGCVWRCLIRCRLPARAPRRPCLARRVRDPRRLRLCLGGSRVPSAPTAAWQRHDWPGDAAFFWT